MDISSQNHEEIKKILEENRQYLKAIYRQLEKTRRYIFWGRVISVLYFVILVAPLILAIIYLPPLLEQTLAPYQELLGAGKGESNAGLLEQFQGLLNNQ